MLPSEWAIVAVAFGEGKKHLYSTDKASLEFFPTYDKALEKARLDIEDGGGIIAIMQVNRLLKAKPVEFEVITGLCGQSG